MRRFLFFLILILLFAFTAAGADHVPDSVRAELASLEQQYGVKFLVGEDALSETSRYSEGFDELYYVEHMGSFHRDGDTNPMLKRDWTDTLHDEVNNNGF